MLLGGSGSVDGPSEAASKAHVLRHDSDPLRMDRAQVGVLE